MSTTDSQTQQARRDRGISFGALMSDLSRDSVTLVRDEIDLAKAEMSEKTTQAAIGIGSIAAAGAVLFAGFLFLLTAAMFALHLVLPYWLSALIVGVVVAVIGGIMLLMGRQKLKTRNLLVPQETVASLRHDRDLAREHVTKTERTQ